MLRYRADLKTLLWMVLTTTLLVGLWRAPALSWWLYVPFLYFMKRTSGITRATSRAGC